LTGYRRGHLRHKTGQFRRDSKVNLEALTGD